MNVEKASVPNQLAGRLVDVNNSNQTPASSSQGHEYRDLTISSLGSLSIFPSKLIAAIFELIAYRRQA